MQLGDTTGSYQVRPATQTYQQPNVNGNTTPSNPAAAPPPAAQSVDWTSDPIYQLVTGQQNLAIANAKAEALKQQSQALIAYGDPNLALAVTGDPNVAEAARQNKASTLAQMVATNQKNVRDINENENQQNLFYSSDRGYQLGLNQQAYLYNQANSYQGVQGQLSNIGTQLLAQEQNAYQAEQQAAADAYNRAVQNPGVGSSTPSPSAPTPTLATASTPPPPNNQYGGAGAPIAPGTPVPTNPYMPYATKLTANKSGGSANLRQGVFAIH